jgi:hypothetical protein
MSTSEDAPLAARQLGGGLLAIKGLAARGEMVFAAQIEHAMLGGSRTGALNHILKDHGMRESMMRVNRRCVDTGGVSAAGFDLLKGWYTSWRKTIDPFAGPPKEVSMLPYKVAMLVASIG